MMPTYSDLARQLFAITDELREGRRIAAIEHQNNDYLRERMASLVRKLEVAVAERDEARMTRDTAAAMAEDGRRWGR